MVRSIDDARRQSRSGPGGRVPPHNLSAEESLLGAMLLSRDAVSAASMVCTAEDFYKPAHGHVFDAIFEPPQPGGARRPGDRRRRAAPGGAARRHRRPGHVWSPSRPAPRPRPTRPRTPRSWRSTPCSAASSGSPGRSPSWATPCPTTSRPPSTGPSRSSSRSPTARSPTPTKVLSELLYRSLERIEALYAKGEDITGVPTGYLDIDDKLSGLQPSSLSSSAPGRAWARPRSRSGWPPTPPCTSGGRCCSSRWRWGTSRSPSACSARRRWSTRPAPPQRAPARERLAPDHRGDEPAR